MYSTLLLAHDEVLQRLTLLNLNTNVLNILIRAKFNAEKFLSLPQTPSESAYYLDAWICYNA